MKITMEGKYQTRKDNLPVEILRNNVRHPDFPIVGIITYADGSQSQDRWMVDGKYDGEEGHALDLIPASTKHEGWVIVGDIENVSFFTTKEYAQEAMDTGKYYGVNKRVVLFRWED